jgi:hypothetical protein
LPALRKAITSFDINDPQTFENFHCLCNGGMAGLPMWAMENISVVGNLAERGYGEESVAETLEDIAKTVPDLAVKVHLGGDYETSECVATIALENGKASVGPPEREKIPDTPEAQMTGHLVNQLNRSPLG